MKRIITLAVLIAIIIGSFVAGGWYGKNQYNGIHPSTERQILYYTDPMNPGFRSDEPGVAPCGMPLEPVYAEPGGGEAAAATQVVAGAVTVSPAVQQLIGVEVDSAEVKPMTYTLRLYGKIVPDETKIYRLNASTDSWVRELSDITTGSIVGKDQLLAEVLAPAFYNAQVTYLVAMDNLDRIQKQLGPEIRHQQTYLADNQIRVAVQALQNLGITDAQVEELANTRKSRPYMQVRTPSDGVVLRRNITLYQWFKAGEEFYEIADLGRVWVYADVYEDEAMHLAPGMPVKVLHKQMNKIFDAQICKVLPFFDPLSKTLKVRLDIDNPDYDLRPDMFVDVEIPITMPPCLNVPADAVIDSGTRQLVYVDMGNRVFEPRTVKTGWRLGRRIEIASGLMPGEKVVVSGNFLIDSESRMKTAAGGDLFSSVNTVSEDPVCGMRVDVVSAEKAGRMATYGDRTYYFCRDTCKDTFKKDPEKYIVQLPDHKDTDIQEPEKKRTLSWLQMLQPDKGRHVIKKKGSYPGQKMGRTIGTPAASPGVIDWDGPDKDKEKRDWSGWGKFPGAEYLGLKEKTKKGPDKQQKMPATGNEKASEHKHDNSSGASSPDSGKHHAALKDVKQQPPSADGAAQKMPTHD